MESKLGNLYKLSKERKALRSTLEKESVLVGVNPVPIERELEAIEDQIKSWHITDEGGLSAAKNRVRKERSEIEAGLWVDEAAINAEIPEYSRIQALTESFHKLKDFEMRRQLDIKANPTARAVYERLFTSARQDRRALEAEINQLSEENPTAMRAIGLVENMLSIHQEGHIALTESVQANLDQIGQRLLAGKPIFLHGPTGTGKTSLARLAAKCFTGKNAEMVYCNPQTRESSVWGKTGLRPASGEAGAHGAIETVDIYGPLAKAMLEGKVVIFDEFTALPIEQQVFIKGIFNAKPGDEVNVVGNGRVKIEPGFQMIFTANLKSEKNPERQELPPEIAREFEQNNVKIDYLSPSESFDVMLARLIGSDGSLKMSWQDVNETLPKFCEAMVEIQTAYTGSLDRETSRLIGMLDAGNRAPGLKKLVLTQGTVEAVLEAWQTRRQDGDISFTQFLDQRLKTTLTFEEYPLADRILAAKILALKGLLRTLTLSDINLPTDVFNFDAAKKLRGDKTATGILIAESKREVRISLSELADLDPFNIRGKDVIEAANELLPSDKNQSIPETSILTPEEISTFGGFIKKSYRESWGGNDATVAKAGEKPEMRHPADIIWSNTVQVDAAKLGEFTMNPDTAGIDWEQVPPEKIKVLDFSQFVGKKRWELAKYITTEWPDRDKYLIPGIEYWKYVFEHSDKVPQVLKDGNYYYFYGSIFCNSGGNWVVPVVDWSSSAARFNRHGDWLSDEWPSVNRVVLLEK